MTSAESPHHQQHPPTSSSNHRNQSISSSPASQQHLNNNINTIPASSSLGQSHNQQHHSGSGSHAQHHQQYPNFHVLSCFDLSAPTANIYSLQSIKCPVGGSLYCHNGSHNYTASSGGGSGTGNAGVTAAGSPITSSSGTITNSAVSSSGSNTPQQPSTRNSLPMVFFNTSHQLFCLLRHPSTSQLEIMELPLYHHGHSPSAAVVGKMNVPSVVSGGTASHGGVASGSGGASSVSNASGIVGGMPNRHRRHHFKGASTNHSGMMEQSSSSGVIPHSHAADMEIVSFGVTLQERKRSSRKSHPSSASSSPSTNASSSSATVTNVNINRKQASGMSASSTSSSNSRGGRRSMSINEAGGISAQEFSQSSHNNGLDSSSSRSDTFSRSRRASINSTTSTGSNTSLSSANSARTGSNNNRTQSITPKCDVILSVAFVATQHAHGSASRTANQSNKTTLNFYRLNVQQLIQNSGGAVSSMSLISSNVLNGVPSPHAPLRTPPPSSPARDRSSVVSESAGVITRSYSTPNLNQQQQAAGRSAQRGAYQGMSASNSGIRSPNAHIFTQNSRNSSSTAQQHTYPSPGSMDAFSQQSLSSQLSSLFDIKRTKRQIQCSLLGSWNLHSIPMCHFPYHVLFQTNESSSSQKLFMISATEKQMHCFLQDATGAASGRNHGFLHVDIMDVFPEMSTNHLLSSVICMDVHQESDRYRVMAIGGQNGWLRITVYDLEEQMLIFSSQLFLNGPISAVKFFKEISTPMQPSYDSQFLSQEMPLFSEMNEDILSSEYMRHQPLHLVVAESTGRTLIYRNIMNDALQSEEVLDEYDDSVSCLEIADLYSSGYSNIIVGTYSKKMYVYKMVPENQDRNYVLHHVEYFESPVYGIRVVDLIQDGVREIIVLTMYQLCVLQVDLKSVERVLKQRLSKYRIIHQLAEEIRESREQLRSLKAEKGETMDEIPYDDEEDTESASNQEAIMEQGIVEEENVAKDLVSSQDDSSDCGGEEEKPAESESIHASDSSSSSSSSSDDDSSEESSSDEDTSSSSDNSKEDASTTES